MRAYIKGDHAIVRADHPLYTAEQLIEHELGHDRIDRGEINIEEVRTRLKETVGEENLEAVSRLYAEAYEGTGLTPEEIWTECICDSLGDMNIFAKQAEISEFMGQMLLKIKEATKSDKTPTQTRGSPGGKASRETDIPQITIEDVKKLRSIGRKSINAFTSEEIKKAEPWARKFYAELGTKSPFFRAWFGDWRAYDRSKIKTVTVENIDLADVVMQNGDYGNSDTGWTIHAGALLQGDTVSHARGERISVKALKDVENILENAVLLDTEISKRNNKNKSAGTAFMHKLYAPITYNEDIYIAKISVEEFLNVSDGKIKRRGYNLRAIKIEAVNRSLTDKQSATAPVVDSASINSIADLHRFVKRFDENFSPKSVNPVLLNEDGTPKVFYHGTSIENGDFTVFDYSKATKRGGLGLKALGKGNYFTSKKLDGSERYGSRVISAYLNIENPFIYNGGKSIFEQFEQEHGIKAKDTNELQQAMRDVGFDGVIKETSGEILAVTFEPEQIKSATDNIGTFDGKNPDFHYSRETAADRQYMDAVESGDMDTAQRMVDEAAKEAGYTIKAYHGTKTAGFNEFKYDPGKQTGTDYGKAFYFTSDYQKAQGYSYDVTKDKRVAEYTKERNRLLHKFLETKAPEDAQAFKDYNQGQLDRYINDEAYTTEGGEVKNVRLKMDNPLEINAEGKYYYQVYDEYFETARQNGNDGIIVKNVIDNPRGKQRPIDVYVVFDSAQIKSADAVTYDDNGNVIPLSERFNADNNDIRYSRETAADGRGKGYIGKSMSVNAAEAYDEGQKPLSKWSKDDILNNIYSLIDTDVDLSKLTLAELKENFLKYSSWHHTGAFYNTTDFYSIDEDAVNNITQRTVDDIVSSRKKNPPKTAEQIGEEIRNKSILKVAQDTNYMLDVIFESGVTGLKSKGGILRRYSKKLHYSQTSMRCENG